MAQPIDEHTLLLLHGEDLKDSSPYNVPITNNGVQVSTTQSKFGGKSLYFNGRTNLKLPTKLLDASLDEWTIDWWERPENGAGTRFATKLITSRNTSSGLLIGTGGTGLYASSNEISWDIFNNAPFLSISPNIWTHWAVIKAGNILKSFKNGKLYKGAEMSKKIFVDNVGNQCIGEYNTMYPSPYKGYIDEFRISDIARWTSDFIPSKEPYTNIPDFSYQTQVPFGSSKKVFARLYPQSPDKYFQTDLTNAVVELELKN